MLVIVGTVVVITLVAGAGTWILARQSTRTAAIGQVRSSAQAVGKSTGELRFGPREVEHLKALIPLIRRIASLDGVYLLPVVGGVVNATSLKTPVVSEATMNAIEKSGVIGPPSAVAGSTGSEAWTAEAVEFTGTATTKRGVQVTVNRPYVIVLTRKIGSPTLSGDFLILAAAVIAFAIVMSLALSRRITKPLRRAVSATQRIAAGDLDARVGAQPGDFPELSSLANSIDAMAEGLSRLRNAERQFLLSVSHELRTPLTSIRGYSEAILDGATSDPTHAAAVIGNEARRLERLVGDLLDLAKLDARTFSLHFRTIDVAEVVEEVAEELRPVVDNAGLQLTVYPPARPLFARVDPDRLDQVLANLVENAAKYARTRISLGGIGDGAEARLIVEDDGPGIAPEEIGLIFNRHYSADRHARPGRPRGSGLGLAIAAELSAAMGATMRAESPIGPGGGTRMVVRLPSVAPSPGGAEPSIPS
jgi:two-component system sensor histidine kinase BaeS